MILLQKTSSYKVDFQISPVILKGMAKAPAVDHLRLNTLSSTKTAFFHR